MPYPERLDHEQEKDEKIRLRYKMRENDARSTEWELLRMCLAALMLVLTLLLVKSGHLSGEGVRSALLREAELPAIVQAENAMKDNAEAIWREFTKRFRR